LLNVSEISLLLQKFDQGNNYRYCLEKQEFFVHIRAYQSIVTSSRNKHEHRPMVV